MKFKFIIIIAISFLLSISVSAQPGNRKLSNGIGLRGGIFNGLTFKHFIDKENALEGIVTSRWEGVGFTGLYEIHNTAFDTENLFWYYGGGAHISFWNGNNSDIFDENRYYTLIGLDGIIGIEYYFKEAPINVGIDWKPCFNIIGTMGFWPDGGAISVRYIF